MYSPRVEREGLFVPSLGIELQDQLVEAYGAQQSASLYLKSVPVVISLILPIHNIECGNLVEQHC